MQIGDVVTEVLQNIWERLVDFLPAFLGAVLILIIGWIIADLIAWLVDRVLRIVRLPDLFKTAKVEDLVKRAGSKLDTTGLIAGLIKWIVLIATFIAAANIMNLETVEVFLDRILAFLPNVVAAGAILLIGAIFAHFMASVIKGAISAANLAFVELVGNMTKYAILVFAILAAISQLGIAEAFLQSLFYGIVAFIAIAGGLAFGLGGQGVAREWMEKFKKELEG
jgi:small-conductance mechanosensitive channel